MAKAAGNDPLEKALDMLYASEFLLIIIGSDFGDGGASPLNSDMCSPALIAKPNKFMGFWGELFNRYLERNPHEGYVCLRRWAEQLFNSKGDDHRKRKQGKKKAEEEDGEVGSTKAHRCYVVTASVDSFVTRIGFEQDQVYEMLGNISYWQCSIPCKQEHWMIDKAFRFEIDPTNQEALPIKYQTDDRHTVPPHSFDVSDDEDCEFDNGISVIAAGTAGTAMRDPQLRQKLHRATTIRIPPELELANLTDATEADNFASEPPTQEHQILTQTTFGPSFDQATEVRPESEDDEATEQDPQANNIQPYTTLSRFSHRLQHIRALVNEEHSYNEGVFNVAIDPTKALEHRKAYYSSIQPFFNHEDPKNGSFQRSRLKYIWYNISVFITDASKPTPNLSTDPQHWSQGVGGRYYFNFVQARGIFQEPSKKRFVDIVRIPFPRGDKEGRTKATILPANCRISTVVECFIGPKEVAKATKGGETLPTVANPFKRICFQLVGSLSAPEHVGSSAPPTTALAQVNVPITESEKICEHILETSQKTLHCMKIGVPTKSCREVVYMEWEIACDDELPVQTEDVATVRRHEATASAAMTQAFLVKKRELKKGTAPRPTTNHQLCVACHQIARPRVQMSAKDPSVIPFTKKNYAAWEKSVMEQMKQSDSNRLLVLELGCTKKMDAVRRHSEGCWKKVKNSGRASFVRIATEDLESKKGAGGSGDGYLAIQGDPKESLKRLDRMLSDKIRKKQQ